MAGITSVGAYIPFHRLGGDTVRAVWGSGHPKASRPLAGFDEDPITMGVEALINAAGWGDSGVDSLYFASTTHPYAEKSNASVLAAAADLPERLFTLDAGGSVRAGTSALKAACDAIEAGSSKAAAVVAAEKRPALPGSPDELSLCDGAAAVLLGKGEDVAAEIEAVYSWSEDFIDRWRLPGEGAVSAGDAKFIQDYGYVRQSVATVEGLLGQTGATREDIARVLVYAPDARTHAAIARKLGFPDSAYPEKPLDHTAGRLRGGGAPARLGRCAPGRGTGRAHRRRGTRERGRGHPAPGDGQGPWLKVSAGSRLVRRARARHPELRPVVEIQRLIAGGGNQALHLAQHPVEGKPGDHAPHGRGLPRMRRASVPPPAGLQRLRGAR